jgi:hypothetical protein
MFYPYDPLIFTGVNFFPKEYMRSFKEKKAGHK